MKGGLFCGCQGPERGGGPRWHGAAVGAGAGRRHPRLVGGGQLMAQFLLRAHKAPLLLVLSAHRLHVLRTKPSRDSRRRGQLASPTTAFPVSPSGRPGLPVPAQPAQECPAKALLAETLPGGDDRGDTRLSPPLGAPTAGPAQPQAVVLPKRLMPLVESEGGLRHGGKRLSVPGGSAAGGKPPVPHEGSAGHRALREGALPPLPKNSTGKSAYGLEKNPVLKPVSGHKAEHEESSGEHGPDQPSSCHKDTQEQRSSARRLLTPARGHGQV